MPAAGKASPARRRYRCRTGAIAIACENQAHWRALAKSVGRPELAYEGSWHAAASAPPRGRLGRVLEELFAEDDAALWLRRLQAHGVPAGVVRDASTREG